MLHPARCGCLCCRNSDAVCAPPAPPSHPPAAQAPTFQCFGPVDSQCCKKGRCAGCPALGLLLAEASTGGAPHAAPACSRRRPTQCNGGGINYVKLPDGSGYVTASFSDPTKPQQGGIACRCT